MNGGLDFSKELEERELSEVAPYGLRSAERRRSLGERFRMCLEPTQLEYRTEYHRDRDRILWSTAFKRLQHKTQIFPHYVSDPFRRRLTHSLEVAQIATTLARALRLNQVAAEAIALAHDIGHTPFGHGGEEALNRRLVALVKPNDWLNNWDGCVATIPPAVRRQVLGTSVAVYAFDHCVQGVEEVSRVSSEYAPLYPGLNLTFDVRDGILKHIYDRTPDRAEGGLSFVSSLENIVRLSEFAEFGRNSGSLEAQCVWFADKVGYLLGDMDDSLRSHLVSYKELSGTELVRVLDEEFKRRRNGVPAPIESHEDFLAFQRRALAVLILDCVETSSARLGQVAPHSVDDVLAHGERLVNVDERIRKAWDAHYAVFCRERIFRHENVQACCFKAQTIVDQLFAAYWQNPDLIPEGFRRRTERAYGGIIGAEEVRVMSVRNYIAGMTDPYATAQHKRLYMSSEPAGTL
jgi:dGTPase